MIQCLAVTRNNRFLPTPLLFRRDFSTCHGAEDLSRINSSRAAGRGSWGEGVLNILICTQGGGQKSQIRLLVLHHGSLLNSLLYSLSIVKWMQNIYNYEQILTIKSLGEGE